MNSTLRWTLALCTATAAAVGAVVLLWEPIAWLGLDVAARRPLWEVDVTAIEACTDPGYGALAKVLAQDLRIPCSDDWFATTLAPHLEGRKLAWTRELAEGPIGTSRQRVRAATALLYAGQPAVPGLSFLVTDPDVDPATHDDVVVALLEARFETTWADPVLRDEVTRLRFKAGRTEEAALELRGLRLAAAQPAWMTPEERAARVDGALAAAGLGDGLLEEVVRRQAAGQWVDVPDDLAERVREAGGACDERASSACVRLAADLLEAARQTQGDTEPYGEADTAARRTHGPDPLWTVLYDGDEGAVVAAEQTLGAVAAWVAEAPEGERLDRVMGALVNPRHRFGVAAARAGRVGDPAFVVPDRGGSPWTVAAAVLAVAADTGLDVTAHAVDDGVVLAASGRRWAVGMCGARVTLPPETPLGPSWSGRAVLAQATVEAVGAARRRGDDALALRLAHLAQRLDPIGADGVVAVVAKPADDVDHALGRTAGALATPAPPDDPVAIEARTARAVAVVASAAAATDGCPGPLSP